MDLVCPFLHGEEDRLVTLDQVFSALRLLEQLVELVPSAIRLLEQLMLVSGGDFSVEGKEEK